MWVILPPENHKSILLSNPKEEAYIKRATPRKVTKEGDQESWFPFLTLQALAEPPTLFPRLVLVSHRLPLPLPY